MDPLLAYGFEVFNSTKLSRVTGFGFSLRIELIALDKSPPH